MGNYNGKNKKRKKSNQRPIEDRSDKICSILIKELFNDEICLICDLLEQSNYSKIDIHLDEGLTLVFDNNIEYNLAKDLKIILHKHNIKHKFNKNELIIFK